MSAAFSRRAFRASKSRRGLTRFAVVFPDATRDEGTNSVSHIDVTMSRYYRKIFKSVNRFYAAATSVLIRHDGLIEKLIGDEVMGLFISGLAGPGYRRKTALAALDLAATVDDVPIGVAAHAGRAFVGNVGSGTVKDFTALGDAINIGARLQSHASPRQVVLTSELYALVADNYPGGRPEQISVRGRTEPVKVHVLAV
jgi:adenylate cyclase